MENIKSKINTQDKGIFAFIGGFALGILISSLYPISIYYLLVLFLIGITIITFEIVLKRMNVFVILCAIFVISLSLGSIRYEIKNRREIDNNLVNKLNEKSTVEGLVTGEIERKDNVTRIIVTPATGAEKILVSTDLYSHVQYGDEVLVTGKLEEPKTFTGDNGREFDYAKYLSKDDIYYVINFAKVEVISGGHGHPVKSLLYKTKNNFIEKIRYILPEPQASLLAGLVLAGKDTLPKNILDEFRRAGIVHIVVLSGYNVTIIALFFLKIFSFLSLRAAGLSSIFGIILFTLMTGASATVVRAAIMASIFVIGKFIRRDYSAGRALMVAGFIMLLENPKILIFDASFKLSFIATLGLIYGTPIFEQMLKKIPEKSGFRTILATSISTQLAVLPYLLYSTGNFSIVSLLANVLILMFIPITMLFGFVASLLGFISTFVAIPVAYLTNLLLSWILFVADWLGNLKYGSVDVPTFSLWIILVWYLIYLILWKKLYSRLHLTTQETSGL